MNNRIVKTNHVELILELVKEEMEIYEAMKKELCNMKIELNKLEELSKQIDKEQ